MFNNKWKANRLKLGNFRLVTSGATSEVTLLKTCFSKGEFGFYYERKNEQGKFSLLLNEYKIHLYIVARRCTILQ
jgi:hypothetical protein